MDKYQDQPMDLADASLVAAAERLGVKQLFTGRGGHNPESQRWPFAALARFLSRFAAQRPIDSGQYWSCRQCNSNTRAASGTPTE